jgi:hypothetical protein
LPDSKLPRCQRLNDTSPDDRRHNGRQTRTLAATQ